MKFRDLGGCDTGCEMEAFKFQKSVLRQQLNIGPQQKCFGTPKCPRARDREKRSEYRCRSPVFICFFRSGLPSCLCFVRSGLPSRFQNCIGTPKNSRQIFCLSRQRRLLLGTAHKLKIKIILTRVMCFFVKGLLATITNDRREI